MSKSYKLLPLKQKKRITHPHHNKINQASHIIHHHIAKEQVYQNRFPKVT